jgi:hypothetical protein
MAPGFVVVRDSGFYIWEGADTGAETDKLKWSVAMPLGERISIGEGRKATYDNRVNEYVAIRRANGAEGFVRSTLVIPGTSLGVVTDDRATLYRSPSAIDVSNVILSRKTIVVCYPETEGGGFIKVAGYDTERQAFIQSNNNYVRTTSISRKDPDVQSCILLQTALALDANTQKVRRDALLDSALVDHPTSVFHSEIMAIVHPNAAPVVRTITFTDRGSVIDDNVNVRDQPNISGRVVGQVHNGDSISARERTAEMSQIGGDTDYWYKITSPMEGWVFGAFVSFK